MMRLKSADNVAIDKLKQLLKTINTIVKARNIQNARVDANVMRKEHILHIFLI
jgi:hypothetical protein